MSKQETEGQTRTNEEVEYAQLGSLLGLFIEQRLHVPHASLLSYRTLALIGVSVYAGDQFSVDPAKLAVQQALERTTIPDSALRQHGLSRDAFATQHDALVGTRLSDGSIAEALRTMSSQSDISSAQEESVRRLGAELYAYQDKIAPVYEGRPGFRLDIDGKVVRDYGGQPFVALPTAPTIVIEYGPGLAAKEKIKEEAKLVPMTVMIDTNPFVSHFLQARARLEGLASGIPPLVRTSDAGIAAETTRLLPHLGQQADIIIAARIVPATTADLRTGIENGYKLLKPGGIFLAQERFFDTEPDGSPRERFLHEVKEVFGPPQKLTTFPFPFRSKMLPAYNAAFVKQ